MDSINCLPDDKILDWSKMKVSADKDINVTQKLEIVFIRLENMMGKEENAG